MTIHKSNPIVSLRILVLGICVTSFASSAVALPINIDATASSAPIGFTTISGTIGGFTVPSNANRALVVTIGGEVSTTVSSVTFGSEFFTEADTAITGITMSSIWYLLNPSATTADITVTRSASTDNGWAFGALSLSNVAQQAPITAIFDSGDSLNPSVSLTTISTDSLIVEALGRNDIGVNVPQSGQSVFLSSLILDGGAGILGSTDQVPVAGLTTQSWILSNSTRSPLVAAAFSSMPEVPEPSSFLLLGLGALGLMRHTRRRRRRA